MPPRKAGGRKRKRRTEVEPGLLEKNDQGEEDKQSVDGPGTSIENVIQDTNALVDQVSKKYKPYEYGAPYPDPTCVDVPRSTEGEQTPQDPGDGTRGSDSSSGHDKENLGGDQTISLSDQGRCSRTASLRRRGVPDGTGPDLGRSSRRMASLRKSTLASVSSGKSLHDATISSEGSSRCRLHTPELPSSPDKHSTPYPTKKGKDKLHDSLFGFEDLESPLVLSPLVLSPVKPTSDCNVEEQTPRRGAERHVQHWRTHTAAIHVGPKQQVKSRNKAKAPEPSGQEEWIKRMNEEFNNVEQYDLVIQ